MSGTYFTTLMWNEFNSNTNPCVFSPKVIAAESRGHQLPATAAASLGRTEPQPITAGVSGLLADHTPISDIITMGLVVAEQTSEDELF